METKSGENKPEEIKPDETKPDETKPEETNPEAEVFLRLSAEYSSLILAAFVTAVIPILINLSSIPKMRSWQHFRRSPVIGIFSPIIWLPWHSSPET